jgi:hypothetical protein
MAVRFICPSMHAEHLHMPSVWRATRATLERSRLTWTIFVDPLLARIEHLDLAPALTWFAEHGHEVALHTHHHRLLGEPGSTTGFVTGQRLSDDDVHRCLQENFDYLSERGHEPKGFVSGSWLVLDSIYEWLAARGFAYDSTLRTYAAAGPWSGLVDDAPCPTVRRVNGILEVPTTAPITAQLRGRIGRAPRTVTLDGLAYDLYYLHDYDLTRAHKRWAVRLLDRSAPKDSAASVSVLAQRIAGLVPG